MIDTEAKPKPYFRLMALVALMGIVSALVTFVFMAFVNGSIAWIWEEAALALGMDPRLFTLLVCTLGGLLVGLLVNYFGDHNAIFSELMREFGKTGRFDYRHAPGILVTSFVSLIAGAALGPGSSPGGYLRCDRDLDRRQAQAWRKGDPHNGFRRPERHAGRLCHQSLRRGSAQPGVQPRAAWRA